MSVAVEVVPSIRAASGRRLDPRVELLELFAACVAHELRTPLATQRALLELALGDPGLRAAGWREIAEEVLDACLRQERLLEACLGLARARSPRRRERVDLAVVAAEALEAQEPEGLDCVVALDPAWIVGDPVLLRRLAANLVSNAVRHNVAGGRIDVTTRRERGRAHLTVANTGAAVPAGELRRLFEPFERLVADGGEGVGLGLTIVQAVAAAHRARICVRAPAGGGLDLDVAFPAVSRRGTAR